MAKKNDPTELQNNADLQKTVDTNAAPAETAPLVGTDANNTITVPPALGSVSVAPPSGVDIAPPDAVGTATPADTAQPQETVLFTLDALADKHRVASWQQAALLRLTGWAAGKEVSEADYTAALNNLQYRRMGSGRA